MITVPRIFNSLLDDSFFDTRNQIAQASGARTDIIENAKDFTIMVDAPGYDKSNFDIEVTDDNYIHVSAS